VNTVSSTLGRPLVPGRPEGGTGQGVSGTMVTIPMIVAIVGMTWFFLWAFDSLRWWFSLPASLAAVAIGLVVSIFFANRAMREAVARESTDPGGRNTRIETSNQPAAGPEDPQK
jgi:hypothetical protein